MSRGSIFEWVHGTALTQQESSASRYHPEALRPVLFVFYTLETVFNMVCMGFHIIGFTTIDHNMFSLDVQAFHYIYLITFYIFMVLTLFQSINICTGHTPTLLMEICKASAAFIAFTLISLTSMWDAERQFHMFFSTADELQKPIAVEYGEDHGTPSSTSFAASPSGRWLAGCSTFSMPPS